MLDINNSAKCRHTRTSKDGSQLPQVDVISTDDCWCDWLEQIVQQSGPADYYRMKATLGEIFERDFFTEHIKSRNVSMICEGNTMPGNAFSLCKGLLMLHLDRESYERSGLSGKPDKRSGNREMRSKWRKYHTAAFIGHLLTEKIVITHDMTSSSMQHGKRGFDRILYGCKSISDQPLSWLCVFSNPPEKTNSLKQFLHTKLTSQLTISQAVRTHQTVLPSMPNIYRQSNSNNKPDSNEEATASELYEWLSLVRLESPRVLVQDSVDPYLSRYNVPSHSADNTVLKKICWEGLLDPSRAAGLASALSAACPSESWFAISATSMTTGGLTTKSEFTILKQPGKTSRYMTWDIKHSS